MIVLSGASASGKTEVAKILASKYGITKVITTTTRPMRKGEINGRDYFFVTKEQFLEKKANRDFVEYTQYNGNLYGSTKDQVADDKCVVIDPVGMKSYILLKNPTVCTFFLDCCEKIRYERMLMRGDHKNDALTRIENDRISFAENKIPKVNYRVTNEDGPLEVIADYIYEQYTKFLAKKKR